MSRLLQEAERRREQDEAAARKFDPPADDDAPESTEPGDLDTLIGGLAPDTQRKARELRAALGHIDPAARIKDCKHPAARVIGFALNLEYGGDLQTKRLGRLLCLEWDGRAGGRSVKTYDTADPHYADNGKVPPVTLDSVFKLARQGGWSGKVAQPWGDPEPLPEERPAVQPFDLGLLPAVLRPWVEDIADRMQCPVEFPAVAVMVMCGSVIGRRLGIRPKRFDDWTEVPNLWGGVVGRPGVMKTPALTEALKPLRRLTAAASKRYEEDQRDWEIEQLRREIERDACKTAAKKAAKSRDKDAIDEALREIQQLNDNDDDRPIERVFETNDATVEKLGELLRDNPDGFLVFRDELTGWLARLDMEAYKQDRSFYLECWSGKSPFVYHRIGRGTIRFPSACVSILGGIQPGPLADYVLAASQGGAGADGLLQRFQLLVWPDDPECWRNVDRSPDSKAREAAIEALSRLAAIEPEAIGAIADAPDEIPYLRFSEAAQEHFDRWRAQLENDKLRQDHPDAFEAHLSKYRKLVPALALLTHLIDGSTGPVNELAMLKAASWAELLESHARRVYAVALHPGLAAAHRLAAKIQAGALDSPFKPKSVYDKGWRGLDRKQTALALRELEDSGWLRSEKQETGGRPSWIYHINPALLKEANQ